MSPTPRQSLDPSYLAGLLCPICGREDLLLKTMDRYPDYVTCHNCESQFVVEQGGERVMYGKIPASYPRTQRFALQQWAWPEAIARRAEDERPEPSGTAPLEEPAETEPEEVAGAASLLDEVEAPAEMEDEPTMIDEPPAEEMAEGAVIEEAPSPVSPEKKDPPEGLEAAEPSEPAPWEKAPEEDPAEAMEWEGDDSPTPPGEDEAESLDFAVEEPFPWDQPEETSPEGEAVTAFDEEAEEEAEFEPAPEMPDWLADEKETKTVQPSAGMDSFEGQSLEDAGPSESLQESEGEADEFGEGEDVLAALWQDEEAEDAGDVAAAGAAGLSGLGALAQDDEDEEGPPLAAEEALWPEYEEDLEDPFAGAEAAVPSEEAESPPEEDLPSPEQEATTPSEQELAEMYWTGGVAAEGEPEPVSEPPQELEEREPEEPAEGARYRVVLDRSTAAFPNDICAHCSRGGTAGTLSITARIFQGAGLGERQMKNYRVPLCQDCLDRANARSEEQQTAQLQAHLISVLIALVLVVGGLALGLINFERSLLLNLAILGLLLLMGYAVPAALLLIRASRYPKPADATYVQTTLRVPADTEGMETAFEWRNQTYAAHFRSRNEDRAVSNVNRVQERDYEAA